jgi:shikimate kinase
LLFLVEWLGLLSNCYWVKEEMASLAKPIVLIGLMGAGKSTIGHRLATSLDLPFVDSDHEIEEAAGCSITDIFAVYDEEIFRDLERRVIKRLLGKNNQILATGGGAYLQEPVKQMIQQKAFTIWLRADLDVLLERVGRRDTRPLLAKGNKRQILSRLIKERYPKYEDADMIVDSGTGPHENVVKTIVKRLKSEQPDLFNG